MESQFVSVWLFSSTLMRPGSLDLLYYPKILMPEPWLVSGQNSLTIRFSVNLCCMEDQDEPRGGECEKSIEEAAEQLVILENELEGKKFFSGDEIGLVDIAANFVGLWLAVVQELLGIELLTTEKFPRICEWIDDYLNNTIIKETLPTREELLDRFRKMFQRTN